MKPGRCVQREFEYIRHGTQTLIASFNIGLWTRSRLKRDESQIKKDNDGSKQKIRHHSQIYYANISHRA